jgi:hypothetical protein
LARCDWFTYNRSSIFGTLLLMLVPICQFLMTFGLLILYCKILHSCDSSLIGPPVELTGSSTPLTEEQCQNQETVQI